jgi:hypothetical protein
MVTSYGHFDVVKSLEKATLLLNPSLVSNLAGDICSTQIHHQLRRDGAMVSAPGEIDTQYQTPYRC